MKGSFRSLFGGRAAGERRSYALLRRPHSLGLWFVACLTLLSLLAGGVALAATGDEDLPPAAQSAPAPAEAESTSPVLGVGDTIAVSVQGQPQMSTTAYVGGDGAVALPLVGRIVVGGLAPDAAAQKIAEALRTGGFFVDPQVSVLISKYKSRQISVLGEVHTPARYPLEVKTSIFDLLAEAGGINENGSDQILLLRTGADGQIQRTTIDLSGMTDSSRPLPTVNLQGGDTIFVPRAQHFYIAGEVQAPNMYRLEPNMTVLQAIARGGGLTQRGSRSRIEIERKDAKSGDIQKLDAKLDDRIQPDDVIRVKERLF